jgi:membrane protein YqaA with SNARE-associated domain
MSTLVALLAAWAIAFVINLVPAFMPPTWSVLAIFHVLNHPPLLLLTVGGAAMSALGRVGLALLSRRFRNILPATDRRNAEALSAFVNRHRRWREAIVFGYCLGPFPSNAVFVAAGVGRVPLLPVTIAFFLSRCIADTLWVWTAGQVTGNVGGLFVKQLTDWKAIALQIVALAAIVLFFRLPWARWLGVQPDSDAAGSAEPDRGSAGRMN